MKYLEGRGGGSSNNCLVIVLAWASLSSPASHSSLLCYLYVFRISLVIANVAGCELRGQGICCPRLCQDLAGCQKRKLDLQKEVVWLEICGRVLTSSLFPANRPTLSHKLFFFQDISVLFFSNCTL